LKGTFDLIVDVPTSMEGCLIREADQIQICMRASSS